MLSAQSHVPGWPPAAIIVALLAATALRGLVAGMTDLTEDEAYYRLWALVPAASYLDHPPLVGWLIWLGRTIAGDTALGIRLMAVVLPLAGTLALWRVAALLFDEATANRAVLISLAMPLLMVGGVIITPDTPSVLFWGLSGWALAELAVSRNPNWWLVVGLFAGLGLLSKYTNLFVGAGILIWLALPTNWHWLRTWQVWAGGALAILLATPVLWWNWLHDGASFAKQFGRVGSGTGLTLRYAGELIGGYAGLASPVIALLAMLGVIWCAARLRLERPLPLGPLLLLISIVPLLGFMSVQVLGSRVQPNWLAPLYPSLAVFAALAIGSIRAEASQRPRLARLTRLALPVGFVLSGGLLAHTVLPIVVTPRDPTSQMRGWPEFVAALEDKRRVAGAHWIASDGYGLTGHLTWHFRDTVSVVQMDERLRYIHLPQPAAALLAQPGLHVALERNARLDTLKFRFRSVIPLGIVARRERGVELARYVVTRVADPVGAVLDPP